MSMIDLHRYCSQLILSWDAVLAFRLWPLVLLPALPFAIALFNLLTWRRGSPLKLNETSSINAKSAADSVAATTQVSVLIPARNEERNIAQAVLSAVSQRDSRFNVAAVIVYDDQSSDATASIVSELAAKYPQIKLIQGVPLPAGWVGKAHACHRLLELAETEVVVFMDADVQLQPDGIRRLLSLMQGPPHARLITAVPRQRTGSFYESLILPLLHLTYTCWLPLRLVELGRDPRFVAANGQLIAANRDVLVRAGGFQLVQSDVVDDVALVRALKQKGIQVCFADGFHMASCRMYHGKNEVRAGFSKNLFEGLGSIAVFAFALGLHFAAFILPYLIALVGVAGLWLQASDSALLSAQLLSASQLSDSQLPPQVGEAASPALALPSLWLALTLVGSIGICINLLLRVLHCLRFSHPWHTVLTHPVAVLELIHIAFLSLRAASVNRLSWAGRSYQSKAFAKTKAVVPVPPLGLFRHVAGLYVKRRLRRSFHDVRLVDGEFDPASSTRQSHLKQTGPCIFAFNHVAWWDPLLLVRFSDHLKLDARCLMDAESLRQLPFFRRVGALPLDRSSPSRALRDLYAPLGWLTSPKRALAIFPQGQQSPMHLPLQFHRGVARLARKSQLPVVPVGIRYDFCHGPRALVHLSTGPALLARDFENDQAFLAALERAVRDALDRVDPLLASETTAPSMLYQFARADRAEREPWGSRVLNYLRESLHFRTHNSPHHRPGH